MMTSIREQVRTERLKKAEEAVKRARETGDEKYISEKEEKLQQALHDTTHLIRYVGETAMTTGSETPVLSDLLLVLAKEVETAMQEAGAEPGVDYTFVDLFKLAVPLAVGEMQKKTVSYRVGHF